MISRTKLTILTAAVIVPIILMTAVTALAGEDFTVTWSHEPPTAIAGQPLLIRVSVQNHSDDVTTDTRLSLYTGGLTALDGGGTWSGCTFTASPPQVTCDDVTFESEDVFEWFLILDVPSGFVTGSDLAREIEAFYQHSDGDTLDSNHGVSVVTEADLAVTKLAEPDFEVLAGDDFEYTIFVDNFGPSDARNVVVTDDILSSAAFSLVGSISAPNYNCATTGSGASRHIVCTRTASLVAGGRDTIKLTVTSDTSSTIDNTVLVTSFEPDPDTSNNTARVFTSVTDVADLSVDKALTDCWSDGPYLEGECVAGGYAEYVIAVWNDGPSTADNVVVEDLLPAGVTVQQAIVTEGGGSCTTGLPGDPLASLTCNLGPLVYEARGLISIVVQIDPDYVDAEDPEDYRLLENDVWVYSDTFDPDNSFNRDHVIADVYTFSQLAVTKNGIPDLAGVGDDVEYEIAINNVGPSVADTVHFLDLLPPVVDYESYWIEEGTGVCTYHELPSTLYGDAQRDVSCYVDEIPVNGTVTVHIIGRYNEDLWWAYDYEEVCNIIPDDDPVSGFEDYFGVDDPFGESGWWADSYIAVLWENSPISYDPEYLGWCPFELYIEADLSIEKTSELVKLYPGQQNTYHIEVTNNGPTGAAAVIVTDTLPISMSYEIDNADCELVGSDPDVLECSLGNMMPGESKGFDVWALVSPDAPPGEITNEASVSMGLGDDLNPENNSAHATNLVLDPIFADLELQKSWGQAPAEWFDDAPFAPEDCYPSEGVVRAGCPMTYSLTIANAGPLLAENVVVEDLMPAGVTVQGVDSSQGSCTTGIPGDPSAPLTCNLGEIPRDEGAEITVFVVTDAELAWEQMENDAVVSSDIPDPDTGNNRSHVLIWVEPFSYLYLDKEGPSETMAGEEIEYWINLRNDGPSTAHEVYVEDELPGGVSLLSAQVMVGGGSCQPDSALCSLGDVEPGDNRGIRVRGYVEPGLEPGTVVTNTVRAWAESPFFQPVAEEPISDTVETLIDSEADLSITKTADPYKVYAGEQIQYDVSVTNNGPGIAFNVVVTDTFDPGVEYEIATAACTVLTDTQTVLLGSSDGESYEYYGYGQLFAVDPSGFSTRLIGSMTGGDLAAEIEYDFLTGKLYATETYGAPWLHTIDPSTGATLDVVDIEGTDYVLALEFVGSTLYAAMDDYYPYLVTIDPNTGAVTYIGSMGSYYPITGLAYDESTSTMYGVTVGGDYSHLMTIDLATGWATDLGRIEVYSSYGYDYVYGVGSIEFGPDGKLYGGVGDDYYNGLLSSHLIEIDPETGYATDVFDMLFSTSGLTLAEMSVPVGVECSLGDIAPGETSTFSIWARVNPETLGMITNRVDVFSDTEDPNPDNDWDTEASLVLGKADLNVEKFGPSGLVRAGEYLEYTIIVDNLGPGTAHDVVLFDEISPSAWGWEVADWESDRPVSCSLEFDDYYGGSATFTCWLSQPLEVMSPSSTGRWILKVWLYAYEPMSIHNKARVVTSDFDPDLSNNEGVAQNDISAVSDLELHEHAYGEVLIGCDGATGEVYDEVAAGGLLTYILEVENYGPSTAENLVLENWGLSPFLDILSVDCYTEYSFCSCTTTDLGELGDNNRRLECNLGTLDLYDEAEVIIVARIPSDVPEGIALLKNDARVYSDMFDDYNVNNLVTNWTDVIRTADLAVEKTQDPEIALPGMDVTYTITVTNLGLSDVEGVFISDTTPVQVLNPTWTCCASDDGDCDIPCEPPTCPVEPCPWPDIGLYAQADIPAGEWTIYTISGTLDWWPCGPFTNTVEVIAPQSLVHPATDVDPCDENNTDIAVNDPLCHFDPLVLKAFPAADSEP